MSHAHQPQTPDQFVELDDTLLEKVSGGSLKRHAMVAAIDCGSCSHTGASADDDAAFNQ